MEGVANIVLIALQLILACHFGAPFLLKFISIQFPNPRENYYYLVQLLTGGLISTDPWVMILCLVPFFVFGATVERFTGSVKYLFMICLSSILSNAIASLAYNKFDNKTSMCFGSEIPAALFISAFYAVLDDSKFHLGSYFFIVIFTLGLLLSVIDSFCAVFQFAAGAIVDALLLYISCNAITPIVYLACFVPGLPQRILLSKVDTIPAFDQDSGAKAAARSILQFAKEEIDTL